MWATEVSNLICSPHFRSSASRNYKDTSFVIGVPTRILLFYQSSGHSISSIILQETIFLFLCLTNHTIWKRSNVSTYLLFTPSPCAKHYPSMYYRGGWHIVSQGFYLISLLAILFLFSTSPIAINVCSNKQGFRQFAFSFYRKYILYNTFHRNALSGFRPL